MPKSKIEIKNWSDYLSHHCKGISEEQAQEYVQKGAEFLAAIREGKPVPGKSQSENMAYLHWYLLKTSFDEGKPFSKGTFNLRLANDEETQKLYQYLKGDAQNLYKNKFLGTIWEFTKGLFQFGFDKHQPYSRTSTHYNKQLHKPEDGHYGLDNDKEKVPLAWHFKTHAFGLTCPKKGEPLSLYIKPETEGANLKNTWETIKHFFNLIKAKISPEKIEGMSQSYRESAVDKEVKEKAAALFEGTNPDTKLQKEFNNELKKCKSIPDIRALLVKKAGGDDVARQFDDYITSVYGTKNQTGGEIRFAFQESGLKSELLLKQEAGVVKQLDEAREPSNEPYVNGPFKKLDNIPKALPEVKKVSVEKEKELDNTETVDLTTTVTPEKDDVPRTTWGVPGA